VDSLGDTMEADMMLWSFRRRCERTRIRTELPSQSCDAVNTWHLPVNMTGGVVEAEADSAGKLVEKNVPAAPAAPRAQAASYLNCPITLPDRVLYA
jgi:hypothetical protein